MLTKKSIKYLEQWKEALKSGKYKAFSTRLALSNEDTSRACCLGVFDLEINKVTPRNSWYTYAFPTSYPPELKLSDCKLSEFQLDTYNPVMNYLNNLTNLTLAGHSDAYLEYEETDSLAEAFSAINDSMLMNKIPGSGKYQQVIYFIDFLIQFLKNHA